MIDMIDSFIQVNDIYSLWLSENGTFEAYRINFACLTKDEDGDSVVRFMDVFCCNKDGQYFIDDARKSENFAGYWSKEELEGVEGVRFNKFNPSDFEKKKHY